MAWELSTALEKVFIKAGNVIHHFSFNDKGCLSCCDDRIDVDAQFACFGGEMRLYLYSQIGTICMLPITTFLFSHSRSVSGKCNVPYHQGPIFSWFEERHMKSAMLCLENLLQRKLHLAASVKINRSASQKRSYKMCCAKKTSIARNQRGHVASPEQFGTHERKNR